MARRSRRLLCGLAIASALAPAASAQTAGPYLLAGPTVLGSAAVGKTLTGLTGNWGSLGQIAYRVQWYRCNAAGGQCLSIHGATAPSYHLVGRDTGKTLGFMVGASDSSGTTTAYASLVGPIAPARPLLETTSQPGVTGTPLVGATLSATTGAWSPQPSQVGYSWERCNPNARVCAAVPGATGSSYTLASADVGHTLLAIVHATNGTSIQNAFSTASPTIVSGPATGPSLIDPPFVAGSAVATESLEANPGIWQGVGPISFNYGWSRCDPTGTHCSPIGQSAAGLTLPGGDVGSTIALTVTATDALGSSSASASLVGPVAPSGSALLPSTPPTISGAATTGATLTLDDGIWTLEPRSVTFAWLRCDPNGRLCQIVTGARSPTYRVSVADVGHRLVGVVTASAGAISRSQLSAATAPVT